MSDLRPHGVKVEITNETVELLFPIGAIDEIQSECNLGIFDVMERILQSSHMVLTHDVVDVFSKTLAVVINYNNSDYQVTPDDLLDAILLDQYPQLASAMLDAFGVSLPEKDEDEDDDEEETIKKKKTASTSQSSSTSGRKISTTRKKKSSE